MLTINLGNLFLPFSKVNNCNFIQILFSNRILMPGRARYKTRGPRGPWVAHLRKRSKATVEPIIENPRGII